MSIILWGSQPDFFCMECTHCGSSKYIKNGVYKNSQRYRCKECNRYFSDKVRKFTYADKRKALDLYLSGMGIRAIARFFGCSHPLIIRWIRVFASSVRSDLHAAQDTLQANQVPEVIEMDEIYTRVKKGACVSRYGFLIHGGEVKLLHIR